MRSGNTGDKGPSDWQLLSGLSLADMGLLAVGFAEWLPQRRERKLFSIQLAECSA
jgi:hypothetical protein